MAQTHGDVTLDIPGAVSRMDISGETFLIFMTIAVIAWAAFEVWLRRHWICAARAALAVSKVSN